MVEKEEVESPIQMLRTNSGGEYNWWIWKFLQISCHQTTTDSGLKPTTKWCMRKKELHNIEHGEKSLDEKQSSKECLA